MKRGKSASKKPVKFFIFIVLVIVFAAYAFVFTENIIKPAVSSIAEVKVKSIISQLVNESVHKQFNNGINMDELLIIKTDENGKVSIVQSNAVVMNRIASELALMIQEKLRDLGPTQVKISLGSVAGSQILSQAGPMVDLSILPIGMTKVNFKTEFESTGINQTRYRVFLETETQAKVIVPFTTNSISLSNIVPIAEMVIVGDVPQSYVMVPNTEGLMDGLSLDK